MIAYRSTCPTCGVVYVWTSSRNDQAKMDERLDACLYCGVRTLESTLLEGEAASEHLPTLHQVISGNVPDLMVLTLPDPTLDWRAWLRALQEALWTKHMDPRTRRPWWDSRRRMTADEWVQVQHLIRQHGLICSMRNANMGFGCGMTIFEPAVPTYPGVPAEPGMLVDITKDHLPLAAGQDRTYFDDGWVAFTPFTHSEENTTRLLDNGLPKPLHRANYEY